MLSREYRYKFIRSLYCRFQQQWRIWQWLKRRLKINLQWSLAVALLTKRRKIINLRLDKKSYYKVYNMNGDEICSVPPTYTNTEVRCTLLRKWNVSGAVADAIGLVPIEATVGDYCESCMSVLGTDDKKLEPNDACIFCRPLLCCIRCSHIWPSEPNYIYSGEQIKPEMAICVRCTWPELLKAADEDIPKHYRLAALAWHGLSDVADNFAWCFLYSIEFDTVLYRTGRHLCHCGHCCLNGAAHACLHLAMIRLKWSIEVVELFQQTLRVVLCLWRCISEHEICFQCIIHCEQYQLIYIYM